MQNFKLVTFSLNIDSIEALDKLRIKYKLTKSEIIRNLILKRVNLKTLKNLEREIQNNKKAQLLISRIPNNLNQIAHQLNEGTFTFNEYKFNEVCEELKDEVKELSLELKINNSMLENIY